MTDEQRKLRDLAASREAPKDRYAFKAGADCWHARAKVLESFVEAICDHDEVFGEPPPTDWPKLVEVAREALAKYRGGAE